jgi:hypothetical protein
MIELDIAGIQQALCYIRKARNQRFRAWSHALSSMLRLQLLLGWGQRPADGCHRNEAAYLDLCLILRRLRCTKDNIHVVQGQSCAVQVTEPATQRLLLLPSGAAYASFSTWHAFLLSCIRARESSAGVAPSFGSSHRTMCFCLRVLHNIAISYSFTVAQRSQGLFASAGQKFACKLAPGPRLCQRALP